METEDRQKLIEIINKNGFILRDETFLDHLSEVKAKNLSKPNLITEVFLLYKRAVLDYHYLDQKISSVVKTIAQRISKQYCENGKCNAKQKYSCCEGCINQTPKGCLDKPNFCLNFFCLDVIQKIPKRIKKVLGLHKCEGEFKEINDDYEKTINNKLSNLISSLLFDE